MSSAPSRSPSLPPMVVTAQPRCEVERTRKDQTHQYFGSGATAEPSTNGGEEGLSQFGFGTAANLLKVGTKAASTGLEFVRQGCSALGNLLGGGVKNDQQKETTHAEEAPAKRGLPRSRTTHFDLDLAGISDKAKANLQEFDTENVKKVLTKINSTFEKKYLETLGPREVSELNTKLSDLKKENEDAFKILAEGYKNPKFLSTFIQHINKIDPNDGGDIAYICRLLNSAKAIDNKPDDQYSVTDSSKLLLSGARRFVQDLRTRKN